MKREPRLQFTDEERAAPELKKSIKKVDKAAAKADKAQSKIPTKKVLAKERTADPATGKVKTRLHFEEMEKKPPSKLAHVTADTPINALSMQFHREVQQSEDDNVGVESAHKLEKAAESGGRLIQSAHRSHQLKPYREATRAEHQLEKANVNALHKKAQTETPTSNPYSKWQQKQAIKKQYAAAKSGKTTENATKTAEAATKTAKKAAEKAKEAGEFVWRHKKGFAIAAGLLLILAFFLNGLSSCSVILEGVASGVTASTYASQDADIEGAEEAYCAMEDELQDYLDTYERTHDYDEYHYDLDSIEHDPYVLISILSALHPGEWTLSDVQGTLQMLFDKQYILTETVTTEIRYRTEIRTGYRAVTDPNTGQTTLDPYQYEVEVPYTHYICTVTLENFDLSHVPVYIMSEEQLGMYATYMSTLGNRPDLFTGSEYIGRYGEGSYTEYDIPPEALEDEVFAAMIEEAEKYLCYPYVWGGSSPSTSFDCSGFVSWVINHSGWDVGRLGAQGLCNICTPVSASNAQPGDLVFFVGTYDTPGVSHVGIYVGDGMFIHCGDPISYANLNSSYWQEHFYCYGRLP
ncbi:MAG: C40 family peptidase [Clostridia bacterium]|nr:C40 family peptidase [Clostridia bacterium]